MVMIKAVSFKPICGCASELRLRDSFHLSQYAAADLFVPCGGRPNSITTDNVKKLFTADGGKPKFRMIVSWHDSLHLPDVAFVEPPLGTKPWCPFLF